MPRSRPWSARCLAALLLLQAVALTAWPALEWWKIDFGQRAHWDQPGGEPGCPPQHDDAMCLICQIAAASLVAPTGRLPALAPTEPVTPPGVAAGAGTVRRTRGIAVPRAPPFLSPGPHGSA
jgi:hypothetical protein